MRRGEIWTVAGGSDYAGKPRPVVIVQDDIYLAAPSVAFCALTTSEADAALFRIAVEPNETNGLRRPSWLMVDKIMTVPKSKLGKRVGRLSDKDVLRLNRAIIVFLGLGYTPKTQRSP